MHWSIWSLYRNWEAVAVQNTFEEISKKKKKIQEKKKQEKQDFSDECDV